MVVAFMAPNFALRIKALGFGLLQASSDGIIIFHPPVDVFWGVIFPHILRKRL